MPQFSDPRVQSYATSAYADAKATGAGNLAADFSDFYNRRANSLADSFGEADPHSPNLRTPGWLESRVQVIANYEAAVTAKAAADATDEAAAANVTTAAAAFD